MQNKKDFSYQGLEGKEILDTYKTLYEDIMWDMATEGVPI